MDEKTEFLDGGDTLGHILLLNALHSRPGLLGLGFKLGQTVCCVYPASVVSVDARVCEGVEKEEVDRTLTKKCNTKGKPFPPSAEL